MLRNLILAWAPFEGSAFCVVAQGETAFAWAWDRSLTASLLAEASAPAGASVIPEALLTPRESSRKVRLVRALEGVDAQVWDGGDLLASRWWPEVPVPEDWARWRRTSAAESGRDADEPMPAVQTLALRQPWADGVGLDDLLSSSSRIERIALGAALIGLVGLSSAQIHQAWQAFDKQRSLVAERDRLAALAGPVVAARDRALVLAADAAALSSQLTAPLPLEVLQHLADRLPVTGVTLRELELSGTRLRIALEVAPALPRATIVKELQAAGWFSQVNEVRDSSGRGWIGFEMQIQGVRPPLTDTSARSVAQSVPPAAVGLPVPPGAAPPRTTAGGQDFPLPVAPAPGPAGARQP